MIRKQYSGNARRARNYIWNAAGRYDFEPPYLAFYPTGEADMYFNMVIGLAVKWFDMSRLLNFFDSYASSGSADEYDELLWLGIENCVYEKEIGERPVLKDLRQMRAADFFRMLQDMSRQQMEMQSMLVYEQQNARWSEVTGRKTLLIGKKRKIYEALRFPGNLDTDGLVLTMEAFLEEFFRYVPGKRKDFRFGGGFRDAVRRGFGKRRGQNEKLILHTADGGGTTDRDVLLTHTAGMRFGFAPGEKDEEYIHAVFGDCVYNENEMRILESELCVDGDAASRLWVCDVPGATERDGSLRADGQIRKPQEDHPDIRRTDVGHAAADREIRDILRKMHTQQERNREYARAHALMLEESIKRLAAGLDTVFSTYARHLPEKARAGRLVARQTYRMKVLHDPFVFLKDGDEIENSLSVTLLLDASMSRLHVQELIAAESYVIARSLMKNSVPVQILSYRTIRGFTVVQRMKPFERKGAEGVFSYTAGGWNRDALAFRLVGKMIKEQDPEESRTHLLLILTDASPNDSMPLAVPGAHFNGREYEGALSVLEAQKAVRKLRADGIRTSAVFLGASAHLDNVHQIFGKEYVRIPRIAQLSGGVASLIEMVLREAPPD